MTQNGFRLTGSLEHIGRRLTYIVHFRCFTKKWNEKTQYVSGFFVASVIYTLLSHNGYVFSLCCELTNTLTQRVHLFHLPTHEEIMGIRLDI